MLDIENIIVKTDKDVYNVKDLERITGLSQNACYKLIHNIKAVSDVLSVSGVVHRVDYIAFLKNQYRNKVHSGPDMTSDNEEADSNEDSDDAAN